MINRQNVECVPRPENGKNTHADEILNIDAGCETQSMTLQNDVPSDGVCSQTRGCNPLFDVKNGNSFPFFPFPFSFSLFTSPRSRRFAMTLAEVLITLGIIGVVASILIPALTNNINDMQYKTAYKKAYSDISQAFAQALTDGSMTPRVALADAVATAADWQILKEAFKISKECTSAQLYSCWANGDTVNDVSGGYPHLAISPSFVDASGRSWALYTDNESMFFVDTNGFKSPNRFGKDRQMFRLRAKDNSIVSTGLPAKVRGPIEDITSTGSIWCNYPPCYYKSWLYN